MTKLIEAIHLYASRAPAHPALVCGGREITYAQLAREILARRQTLKDAGCRLLALEGDNAPDWILWDLAAVAADVPTLPLPPFFHPQQREFVLHVAGASHSAQGVALTSVDLGAPAPLPPATAKITFTSGSTGTPKGVCLSQSGLEDVAASIGQVLGPECRTPPLRAAAGDPFGKRRGCLCGADDGGDRLPARPVIDGYGRPVPPRFRGAVGGDQ